MRRLILLALPLLFAAAPPAPRPALWKIVDADTTIYLFGTVHALPPSGGTWFAGPVRAAFAAADEVAIETIAPADAARLVTARAVDPAGRTLSQIVGPELEARVAGALTALHRPATMLAAFEPWYAATLLTMVVAEDMGITPASGVEPALTAAAQNAGKPVIGLEDFDGQLALLDDLPAAEQRRLLAATLDELPRARADLDAMVQAWAAGDEKRLAALMNDSLDDSPALRSALLDRRNAGFARWIKARLARPGTVFVGVGAGHLGGTDSVQVHLAKLGVTVARVQ